MAKPILYTAHAMTALVERDLSPQWVERVLRAPEWIEADRHDAQIARYFGAIPERGDRFLRVVVVETATEFRIISVFLDRRARPK